MGKRGPQPTPTAILEKRGSWLAKTRRGEPIPTGEMSLDVPVILKDIEAVERWNEVAPQLKNLGVVTLVDSATLIRYCRYWGLWCRQSNREDGERDEQLFDRYQNALIKLEKELGLTPASRSSIRVPEQKQKKDKYIRAI